MIKNKWPVEGKEHIVINKTDIFRNGIIDDFLENENTSFIIASKGMGKTLLMRFKKKKYYRFK
jgi:hypothetical protein